MRHGPEDPLIAHSLAEAYLYLMATPCASCGGGPLKGGDATSLGAGAANGVPPQTHQWRIEATCNACRTAVTSTFQVPGSREPTSAGPAQTTVVNSTDEPSRIVDVGQWIVLFRLITEAASKETDKVQARHLGLEAAQCLEEALKFYDEPDNDLPPPEAFFTVASRERCRRAPEQFARRRLVELRAKLPTISYMRARLSGEKKRPWWRWGSR